MNAPVHSEGAGAIFGSSEEQDDLRRAVRTLLVRSSGESDVRALMGTEQGYDPQLWKLMAGMGLLGLAVPEELGGAGCGIAEVGIVMEEAGAALLCAPYLSTVVLATPALLLSGDAQAAKDLVPPLVEGDRTATLAVIEANGRWDAADIAADAQEVRGTWSLSGTKCFVLDGHTADLILVVARTPGGLSLFGVESGARGMTRTLLPSLDLTRKLATVELVETPARLIGAEGLAWSFLSTVLDLAAVALAAEQVGGAQRALDMAVEYAKVRYQFGRPIGSFQAIKHKCADMLVQLELARSAALFGVHAASHESAELPVAASVAKASCSEAFSSIAAANIQVHGGIGFTWEHPAHLYLKRAVSSSALLGDPTFHRALLAQRLCL